MEDWKNQLINAFLSFFRQIHSFLKYLLFLIVVVSIWLLNDSTQFIRHYRISNKIQNVKEIEQIIQQPKIDSTTKKQLQKLENDIIQRESFLERLYFFLFEDIHSQTKYSGNAGNAQIPTINSNSSKISGISTEFKLFLHIFSSSWIGVLTFFFCIYWLFKNRKSNLKAPLIVMIFAILNIIVFSIITLLIPKSGVEIIDYLVNALFYTTFQLVFLIILLPYVIENGREITQNLGLD